MASRSFSSVYIGHLKRGKRNYLFTTPIHFIKSFLSIIDEFEAKGVNDTQTSSKLFFDIEILYLDHLSNIIYDLLLCVATHKTYDLRKDISRSVFECKALSHRKSLLNIDSFLPLLTMLN